MTAQRACFYPEKRFERTPTKFIIYSIAKEPSPSLQLSAQDRRTLNHFISRTIQHVQGPFRDETWSRIIPQLIQREAAVRNAAFALSALHEHYLGHTSAQVHLQEYSLHHYQKALRQVIHMREPGDSFSSILGVCILACQIESLRGNFEEATRHAKAGMKMIADFEGSSHLIAGLSHDELHSVFIDFQYHVLEANAEESHIPYSLDEALPLAIPKAFLTVEDALPYLHRLEMRQSNFYKMVEHHHSTWMSSPMTDSLIEEHQSIRSDFECWSAALSSTRSFMQHGSAQQHNGFLVLKISEAAIRIDLDLIPRGEAAYDDFVANNKAILKLVEELFSSQRGDGDIAHPSDDSSIVTWPSRSIRYFTNALGIVGLLFEIATRTEDSSLRNEALRLLRMGHRREGPWDSLMAANLVERLVELKNSCTAAQSMVDGTSRLIITEIKLLSDSRCLIHYRFKRQEPGGIFSCWFDDMPPHNGPLQSMMLDIS